MLKRRRKVQVREVLCCEKVRERISRKIPLVFQVWQGYWSLFVYPSIAKKVRKRFGERSLRPKCPVFGFEGSGIDVYKINHPGMNLNVITQKESKALFAELSIILNMQLEVEYLSLPLSSTVPSIEGGQT